MTTQEGQVAEAPAKKKVSNRKTKDTRFSVVHGFYQNFVGGYMDVKQVAVNIAAGGFTLFKSEIDAFKEAFPDIKSADGSFSNFDKFLSDADIISKGGKKIGTVNRGSSISLDSDAKIAQLGVLPEHVEEYKSIIAQMKAEKKRLAELIITPNYSVSLAITTSHKEAIKAAEPTVTQ